MTSVNSKALRTKTIQAAHDLCLSHFEAHPDLVANGQSPEAHVFTILAAELKDLGYARVANLDAILRSHSTTVAQGRVARFTSETADDTALLLASTLTKTAITRSAPTDASVTNTPVAAEVETNIPVEDSGSAQFALAPGAEDLIDPVLASASDNRITSIKLLFDAADRAIAAQAQIEDAIAACRAAIEDPATDMPSLPAPFEPSGFVQIDLAPGMLPAINRLLETSLQPKASVQDISGIIAAAESEIARLKPTLTEAMRQLRLARKAKPAATPARAETLSDIGDCDVTFEKAAKIFPRCYGAAPEVLNFDVPTLSFDVPHPQTPAIDTTFRFNTRVLMEALHAIAENEIIWLYGESGCGKTEFWSQVAAHLGMPFTRLNMDGELTRSDILGSMRFVRHADGRQEMSFVEGLLPRAMRTGGLLLIDELDLGDPEVMPVLQPVLEGNPLVLLEDGGRIVHPHSTFRIAVTGNTKGLGSDNQMYLNAHEQSAATRDRISAFVEMPYLPAEMETQVVMERYPDSNAEFVRKLIQLANKVRDGYRKGEIYTLFSTRVVQYCVARHNRFAGLYSTPEQAALDVLETVIINRLDPASTQTVKELIDNIFVD